MEMKGHRKASSGQWLFVFLVVSLNIVCLCILHNLMEGSTVKHGVECSSRGCFLCRARPVIRVNAALEVNPTILNPENKACSLEDVKVSW